ncbi:MAG TPA: DUF3606 domain-containing protein [Mucilaginibacter sp.]|nr:DUF3606 domain-containing protein [Mucilaginibacter sp.]
MATRGTTTDRKKVNSGEKYELRYEAEKLGISTQALVGAKRATGSNDRKVIEKYLADKKK